MKCYKVILVILIIFQIHSKAQNYDWAIGVGSTSGDYTGDIALDKNGNIYQTGSFAGTVDFDPGIGVYNLTANGNNDLFIAKYTQIGEIVWVKSITNHISYGDYPPAIAIDDNSNIYITGAFSGIVDFDPGPGEVNLNAPTYSDIFVAKYDSLGTFKWAFDIGGGSPNYGIDIKVDVENNVYVTGAMRGEMDFDPGPGVLMLNSKGWPSYSYKDIFLAKYSTQGNLLWAHKYGDTDDDLPYEMTLDDSSNIYITGLFEGRVDFDPGMGSTYLTSYTFRPDMVLAKYDKNGDFIWAFNFGEYNPRYPYGIALDSAHNIYVSGDFVGTLDFDPSSEIHNLEALGGRDIFIAKYSTNGTYIWAKNIGSTGNNTERSYDIDIDFSGNIFITGTFDGTADFDPGQGVVNKTSTGIYYDCHVTKYNSNGDYIWCINIPSASGAKIIVTEFDKIFVHGKFNATTDFNPGTEVNNLTCNGSFDVFLAKYIPGYIGIENAIVCQGYYYEFPDGTEQIIDKDLEYRSYLISNDGSDSIIISKITAIPVQVEQQTLVICSGSSYTFPSGVTINNITESLIDTSTFIAANSCDSIIITTLEIYPYLSKINVVSCSDYTSPSGNYVWTSSGVYTDTIPNLLGCDSVITIDLTINSSSATSITETACDSYTSPSGKVWTVSDTYMDTIPNTLGCDSIITIDLTINNSSISSINETACNSYTSPSGKVWTVSGTYADTIPNACGCDSIITIDLRINNSSISSITETASDSYTSPSGKNWTVTGIYTDTISNAAGCDSIITIDLTVDYLNSIFSNKNILKSSIYPNPADDVVIIDLEELSSKILVEIFTMSGQLALSEEYYNTKQISINLNIPNDAYLIKVTNDKGNGNLFKVLKQ